MPVRYLFGPVSTEFASENLVRSRSAGACLAFDFEPGSDLTLKAGDTWETFQGRFPAGWQPDFIALYLPYRTIPACLWSAPVPLVGLAGDWNLLWHCYRRQLSRCELVLCDSAGVEQLTRAGHGHVRPFNMYGAPESFARAEWRHVRKDIDILFVGRFNGAVQRERMPWLARLARLGDRCRVVLANNVCGEEYRNLLARARIVFNRSVRGEWNQRVGEALAGGALLFQEADNREVPPLLQDRRECVLYSHENLEDLLRYYLEHEEERRAIAEAGHARLAEFTFQALWDKAVGEIDQEMPALRERARGRPILEEVEDLQLRTWQALNTTQLLDPILEEDLRRGVQSQPRSAVLHQALGLALAWRGSQGLAGAADAFQRAWMSDARHVLAGLNLVEVLIALGQKAQAIEQAQRSLAMLDRLRALVPAFLDAGHYSVVFDDFRMVSERAAWENAGRPDQEAECKRVLLRWRLELLLGYLTGEVAHFAEAVLARPDLPISRVGLAQVLAQQGRWLEAGRHLRQALDKDPFDTNIARALHQVLGQRGEKAEQERLAQEYRLISQAAPEIVPAEPWFRCESRPQRKAAWTMSVEEFRRLYGSVDAGRALHGFTPPRDTEIVLALVAHARPWRIVEIGTAGGHMTANLSEWSPDEARIVSIGLTADMRRSSPSQQRCEDPPETAFGREVDHFGKGYKVSLLRANSLWFNFEDLAPIDFAFIDGAHDWRHVMSDSLKLYEALGPGGIMVWHDFNSPTSWVEVREALEDVPFGEPIVHVEGTEVAFLQKSQAPQAAADADDGERDPFLRIAWEGGFAAVHSLALVNREVCRALGGLGHELSLRPSETVGSESAAVATVARLADWNHRTLSGPVEFHVGHQWPPNLQPPAEGRWVIMQPWEFGSLPKSWIAPLSEQVDEVWVPSHYVRDCFVKSGVPADRVQVISLGVDPEKCRASTEPFPLQTRKSFKFLFVGGTIPRKGIDLLLRAYQTVFSNRDDVCLVIKDMGKGSFYQGQTADKLLGSFRGQADAPEVEYIDRELTDEEMAGLYGACNCLVHPFRGEGFGLPIVEAMARGLPAIVTGSGPVLDYCGQESAYWLPAREVRLSAKRIDTIETVDYPWLVEPDLDALRYLLRHVVEHPDEAKAKGELARRHIQLYFTWQQTAAAIQARLYELRQRPARRSQPRAPKTIAYAPMPRKRRANPVSLCMIVKNEEACLETCLKSVADVVDEMIVVDTGSTDRTREIAARFGAKVVDFVWQDSFAAARNESLRHATGKWIMWLDADERLDESNRQRLRVLLDGLGEENVAYCMRQSSPLEASLQATAHVDQVRLFPHRPGLVWEHRVHEQILPSLRRQGAEVRGTDIVIAHDGFAEPAVQGPKVERNLRLLRMEIEEHPDDPFVLYNLGGVLLSARQAEQALVHLGRSLELSRPGDNLLPKLHALVVRSHHELGHQDEAMAACRAGRAKFPDFVELLFWEAVLLRAQGELPGAEASLLQIFQAPQKIDFLCADSAVRGFRARQMLGEIYHDQGRLAEAEAQYRAALAERPDFTLAWRRLAELYLAQARWAELEEACRRLSQDSRQAETCRVLEARAHLARREFSPARQILQEVIGQDTQALLPKLVLSHVLLQEGQDWTAAEQTLRDILALDPNFNEAQHNLQVLLRTRSAERGAQSAERETRSPALKEATDNVQVPGAPQSALRAPRSVSLCMIVKNEENNLPACLASVADLVDEIIVVDTGSTDQTRAIAGRRGAKVFDFPWVDDFAAARNESLRHATGQWIFWMDADDRLDDANRARLRTLFANLKDENVGYVMKCLCLPDQNKTTTMVDHLRLFRNHPQLKWRYRVHEQIVPAVREHQGELRWTDVVVHHTGYQDPAVRGPKLERDLRLVQLDNAEHPNDPFVLFNLGQIYQEQGREAEALPLIHRSLEASDPKDSIVRKLYALAAQCHNRLGQRRQALDTCRAARAHYPDDIELLFQEGLVERQLGNLERAIQCWQQILVTPPGAHFASFNVGLRGYLTRHNLASAYHDLKRYAEAEAEWRAVLAERPDYEAAWVALGDIYVAQGKWQQMDEIAVHLEASPNGKMPAALLRGRGFLARKDFTAARALFAEMSDRFPQAVEPRQLLSHAYLQEGRDWEAAERSLRAVLALDPNHKEATQNLAVLLRQQGKAQANGAGLKASA